MNQWPYNEDDQMEIGNSGWVPIGEGLFRNLITGHIVDETGIEWDENGQEIIRDYDDLRD